MALRFFQNAIDSGAQVLPNQMYRDLQQEFVNLQWDNTSAMITVKEQEAIGSDIYNDIEVWIDSTVADTTTGLKDSNDFCKLIFKDINHRVIRGMMYQFDNNYWIINNYSKYSGLVQQCGIRRCNNRLKIIDPLTGALQVIPCCVDYDMTSPSQQTSRYIITPNNHATVIVQGNELTERLFQLNTRYMLSGRPFKLLAYQNAVEYSEEDRHSTLLYLELYLDELRDGDDIIENIANNGDFNYSISINSSDMELVSGSTGNLTADVKFNDLEVDRPIIWETSNKRVVTIEDGVYNVIGEAGTSAEISAILEGNNDVVSKIIIFVVDEDSVQPTIVIDPSFDKIRQNETTNFNVSVEYNGETYTTFDEINVSIRDEDKPYAQLRKNDGNSYSLVATKIAKLPIHLMVNINNLSPAFEVEQSFQIKVVSMMG